MSVDFDEARWQRVKETTDAWWAGELDRPLMHFGFGGRDPGRPEPAIPPKGFTAFYDSSVTAEQIVDRWDYDLSRARFVGDSFPNVLPNFGPGVLAAFIGGLMEVSGSAGTCWFLPDGDREISDISFGPVDQDNFWFRRLQDIHRAAVDRWEGRVQVAMTDLGGNLDILSTFRPGEKLLMDLYDSPNHVKRLTWEAHEAWFQAFKAFNSVLQPINPGYTAWAPIFSTKPYYILQCDFSYMIGPDTFDEFVKPEIEAACKRLGNAFYHLDGPGQLPHLDSLLAIPELKGIQWVPGAGQPDQGHWPELYRKIADAGKLTQIHGGPEVLDKIVDYMGSPGSIILFGSAHTEAEAEACVRKYGG